MPDIADQYRIIETRAGWRRRADRGRLRFGGVDRHSFLQALLTNDVESLAPGDGRYAAYLTPQGRMIADLHVFARPDHVIADVPASEAGALADAFDKLIFAEQVEVTNVSDALAPFSVIGRDAASVAREAVGSDSVGFVARTDDARLDSYDVFVPSDENGRVTAALERAGAIEIGDDLWTAIRVDAGRPMFGVDMDRETIPLEAGLLERAISTGKGCYVGQEVIIRVLHRGGGRVARRLVKVAIDSDAATVSEPGTVVRVGDRDVGRITSVAPSLDGSRIAALAYVHRDFAQTGEMLTLGDSGARATITGLAG